MLPSTLSTTEILDEVIGPPRRTFVALPDLRVIERAGWLQIITPSFTQGGFNEVAHAVLDPAEADRVIERTIAEYRALGLRFRWAVGPDSAPPDLGDRLARHGLIRSEILGMARITELAAAPDPAITVERVDHTTVDLFTSTMARGWSMDPGPLASAHDLMLATPGHQLYLARHRGDPAGAAGAVMFPRSMYLLGGVVLPEFRKRGIYRALVAARLAVAAATGIPLATSHARAETSGPLLARMGFETIVHLTSYRG